MQWWRLYFQILGQICKFLPEEDLCSTRLVCSTWKWESDRTLSSRQTSITLKTEGDIQRISDKMDKLKVAGGKRLFNNFRLVSLKIKVVYYFWSRSRFKIFLTATDYQSNIWIQAFTIFHTNINDTINSRSNIYSNTKFPT